MRLRSSQTLVFTRKDDEVVAFNYLSRASFCCSPDLLGLLVSLREWTGPDELKTIVPGLTPDASTVTDLVNVTALIEEGSSLADAEEEFRSNWRWGLPAALLHFSLLDREVMTIEAGEDLQRARITEVGQPPFYLENAAERAISLPRSLECNSLLQLMARRRTVRTAEPAPIGLDALSDCLFAGMGITTHTENCIGRLPLSMTPSGGARNPYEAYVYALSVEGLEPGFYHYAAVDHTLARLESDERPLPSDLLGGQKWADGVSCVVFLCAWFERTMWKYDDANAYRVVLIEAGHIGQNVMLAATHHGLSACPTAALNHTEISRYIPAASTVTHSPIYALALTQPGRLS
jgi:SagB-type dehydrogenase family enzyme